MTRIEHWDVEQGLFRALPLVQGRPVLAVRIAAGDGGEQWVRIRSDSSALSVATPVAWLQPTVPVQLGDGFVEHTLRVQAPSPEAPGDYFVPVRIGDQEVGVFLKVVGADSARAVDRSMPGGVPGVTDCGSCTASAGQGYRFCPGCGRALSGLGGGSLAPPAPLRPGPTRPSSPVSPCLHVGAPSPAPLVPATQGRRLANLVLDQVIGYPVSLMVAVPTLFGMGLFLSMMGADVQTIEEASGPVSFVVTLGAGFAYRAVPEALWGRTPAKWITRTRVVRLDGTPPTVGDALIRTLCRYIPFEPFSFFGSDRPSGWHDTAAKTMVVEAGCNHSQSTELTTSQQPSGYRRACSAAT